MLYLDASALIKCYLEEAGTDALIARITEPNQTIFTSILSFAEVHAAMARKHRAKYLNATELAQLRETFAKDWALILNIVELNLQTVSEIPSLAEKYPLKTGDAVHLSAALWINRRIQSETASRDGASLEFCLAGRALAEIASRCGLSVYNPEEEK